MSVVAAVIAFLCVGAGTTTFFVVRHLTEPKNSTAQPVALASAPAPSRTS